MFAVNILSLEWTGEEEKGGGCSDTLKCFFLISEASKHLTVLTKMANGTFSHNS